MYMNHIFLIHSVNGYFVYFHFGYCVECYYEHRHACFFFAYRFVWIYFSEMIMVELMLIPFFLIFLSFLMLHPWHMEVPRLGIQTKLAYSRAKATWDPSLICYLHHSSWQHWDLNPQSEGRD